MANPLRGPAGVVLVVVALSGACIWATAQTPVETTDKYQWLEDVNGERSLAWVKAENARTDKVLKSDPRYAQFEASALKILESPTRLPEPDLNGQDVYNFWQDAEHKQGILRRTSVTDYLTADPHWQTVLDYDALSKQDEQKWVAHGRGCLYPGNELCMVALSAGGEDAATMREFNLRSGQFVGNSFVLPRSKQSADWLDKDTLVIARDWGPGTMTKSGYPFVVKVWKRGQPLEQAKEVFRGVETDMRAGARTLHDGDGHQATILIRKRNFFENEFSLLTPDGAQRIVLPLKSEIGALLKGQLIVELDDDWTPQASTTKVPKGSVVSLDLEAVRRDPRNLRPTVIFSPTAVEFEQETRATKNHLLVTTLANVQGRVYSYTLGANGAWTREKLSVPENTTVHIVGTNWADDRFFLEMDGYLTPSSLLMGDAAANTLQPAKALPPQFDSSRDMVEQCEAVSKDGTKVPYFVVRPKNIKHDGTNSTVMTAYGGFQIATTPDYDPVVGKLWLERGGVFVEANIRGGGEFGPAWHEAGLKTHRQHIYDDFAAV
ncbi:MAG: S9 family peptidase, partial [Acidobacteriaceae bacterium]|nr:S9 family peptidase [Acidobacteriaceae bacterium]